MPRKGQKKGTADTVPCCVIVRKLGVEPVLCPNPSTVLVNVTDEVDGETVLASIPMCDRHSDRFSKGITMAVFDTLGHISLVGTTVAPSGKI